MALPSVGSQISMSAIAAEFGGSVPHKLSDYYGDGNAPSSGEIQMSADFGGTSASVVFVGSAVINATDSVTYSSVSAQTGDLAIAVTHNFSPSAPSGYTTAFGPTAGDANGYKKIVSYRVLQSGDSSVQVSSSTTGFDSTLIILRNVSSVNSSYSWGYSTSGSSQNLSVAQSGVAIAIVSDRGMGQWPTISGSPDSTTTGMATYFSQRHSIFLNYTSGTNISMADNNEGSYNSSLLLFVAQQN